MVQPSPRIDDPVERAIARLRAIYCKWDKTTSVTQMRADWDAAFAMSANKASKRFSIGGIDAEWIGDGAADRPTILYFHGGGFRLGSIASHRDLITRMTTANRARALAVDYRLAPEHRFPAPVADAVAAYRHLLAQDIDAADIVLMGDSAGGNLVLAAMLSLRDQKLPLPKAAVLMSPWTDMSAAGESYVSRAAADPIHQRAMILGLAKSYLGDADPRAPEASPLYADLAGLPPRVIQVGARETVRDDCLMLADNARAAGVDVTLEVWDGMIHVFQLFYEIPQSRDALQSIARFIDARFDASDRRSS